MKKILITAYAVNPYKGSEDGMGWNFIMQAAASQQVIAITRCNNEPHIQRYLIAHPEEHEIFSRIQFMYFDWPKWSILWKKGPILSLIYYYLWQLTLALWLLGKRLEFDIAHNLNFHNDWTPSFLWILGKPYVWGPIGHHPFIPRRFLLPQYGVKAWLQDRMLWMLKCWFWYADPFVYINKWRASHIFCMNTEAAKKLRLPAHKYSMMPSVATEPVQEEGNERKKHSFRVISVGRFVPLKGFDVTIRSFAAFYRGLPMEQKMTTRLVLTGTGPCEKQLEKWIEEEGITHCTDMVKWMPRDKLKRLYQEASVFLFPSHEGAGMVVAEAMSFGLPVLCFKNSGPGEFIHPASSLAVPYKQYAESIGDFATCLHHLFANPDFLALEKRLAKERFIQHFTWPARGQQLQEVYARIGTHAKINIVSPANLYSA